MLQLPTLFKMFLISLYVNQTNTWVDKDSEFYNRSMKSWLQDIDIEMYSTHN